MKYVALLRGINVGGKSRVEMVRLKSTFEKAGLTDVKTYINSGNIIFRDETRSNKELVQILEQAIESDFGFYVKVLVRDQENILKIAEELPDDWTNDKAMKCNVMFLWERFDKPEVLESLTIKPDIDDVKYVAGAILWRVDKDKVTRSGMLKIIGTDLYRHMTIRNCNTLRKLRSMTEN